CARPCRSRGGDRGRAQRARRAVAHDRRHRSRPVLRRMIHKAMTTRGLALPKLGYRSVSWLFLLIAAVPRMLAALAVRALNPEAEMGRLAAGLIRPDLFSIEMMSVVWTVAFAVLGVAIGASTGLLLALVFARLRAVRLLCAFLRSVHELFWALLLI